MTTKKVPFTINYRREGTRPPLFVAGSFSEPPWQPFEMEHSTSEDNEYTFRHKVSVEPGVEYQYKFRIGKGDWWVLDESAPTAADNVGNQNNVLNAQSRKLDTQPAQEPTPPTSPSSGHATTVAEVADSTALLDYEDSEPELSNGEVWRVGFRRLSATPIPKIACVAAEVVDIGKVVDRGEGTKKPIESQSHRQPQTGTQSYADSIPPRDHHIDNAPERLPLADQESRAQSQHTGATHFEDSQPKSSRPSSRSQNASGIPDNQDEGSIGLAPASSSEALLAASSDNTNGPSSGHYGTFEAPQNIDKFQVKRRCGSSEESPTSSPPNPAAESQTPRRRGGWIHVLLRKVFIDWIGGLISRLCGRDRKTT